MALALRERSAAVATGRRTITRLRERAGERAHTAKFRAGRASEEPLPLGVGAKRCPTGSIQAHDGTTTYVDQSPRLQR